jgi:4-amino-4-deoxy-L-arabinose transferase-like glycosyltransferase
MRPERTPVTLPPQERVRRLPSDRWLITAILLVALAIRVSIVAATSHRYVPVLDAADFSRIATSISQGHGFGPTQIPGLSGPSAFRTPAWPALLGAVYWLVGVHVSAGRLLLAVLSTVFVALIGGVAWSLIGRRVALVSMTIAMVYPPLLLAGYGLNYEILLGVFVFGSLLYILEWRKNPARWGLLIGAGLLTGAAILCRENAGLVIVPIAILIWQRLPNHRSALTRIGVILLCLVAVVVPWTIRNALELHSFIPVSDSPGLALAGTYNPSSPRYDAEWIPAEVVPAYRHYLTTMPNGSNEADYVARVQRAAENYAIHHPAYVGEVVFWNTVRFFDLRGPRDSNWLAPLIPWPTKLIELSVLSFYVLALVSIFGIVTRRVRGIPWALWMFPVLWYTSVALSSSIIQYRFIVEPFVILLASLTLVTMFDDRQRASSRVGRSRVAPDFNPDT